MHSITPPRGEVDPIFRTVPLKDRLLARIYDTAQYWIINFLFTWLFGFVVLMFPRSQPSLAQFLALFAAYGWFLIRDGLAGGANIGKNNREIIVICLDSNKECTIARSFARNIVSDISAIAIFVQFAAMIPFAAVYLIVLGVDIWRIAKTPGGRRVGDMIANTQVIYMDDWVLFEQALRKKQASNATA